MLLCLFSGFIFCISPYETIISSIEDLHRHTNFRTFYELFGVEEGTNYKKIRNLYTRMFSDPNLFKESNLSREDKESLLTNAYSIIKDYPNEYIEVLNGRYIMEESKSRLYILVVLSILGIILTSILVDGIMGYFRYKKMTKKEKKQAGGFGFRNTRIGTIFHSLYKE